MKIGELKVIIGPAVIEMRDVEITPDDLKLDEEGIKMLIDGFKTGLESALMRSRTRT